MIYSVDFEEMAGKISYVDVCRYVRDLHWEKYKGDVRDGISVYQKIVRDDFYQINIPCNLEFNDYSFSMYRVIKTLAKVENKSEEELILELLNPLSDILRVRQVSKNVENGSILFEDAINLFEQSKRLLLNATLDVLNFKPLYKGRVLEEAQKFINQCRYGQTEIGSYVISLVCPFINIENGEIQQLSLFSKEETAAQSITRKATRKVIESIDIIKQTIDSGKELSTVIEDERQHISVSFIEALAALNLAENENSIEISAKWAPTISENKPSFNKVAISHDYYSPMKSVIDKYKKEDEQHSIIIEGKIYQLDATPNLENRTKGTVKIVYIDQLNKAKKLQVNFLALFNWSM